MKARTPKKLNKLPKILFFLLVLLWAESLWAAQVSGSSSLIPAINPQTPAPRETVVISLESYQIDLDRANFRWTLNGKIVAQGEAENKFSFVMPDNGVARVKVEVNDGASHIQNYVFLTGVVELLWEAETFTPPFFRGRALATPDSDLRVVAIADLRQETGAKINPNSLIYQWSLNGRRLPVQSGPGKKSITIKAAKLGNSTVKVEVSNSSGNVSANKSVSIQTTGNRLLFYQDRPLQGVRYEEALPATLDLSEPDFTVRAVPYYFSQVEGETLKYEWSVNDKVVEPHSDDPGLLTFQTNENSRGSFAVAVKASSLKQLLQHAQENFKLEVKNSYESF